MQFSFPIIPSGPGQTKIGSVLSQQQWAEWDYDPQRGVIYKSEYEGPLIQKAIALWQLQVANGIAARIRFEKGRAFITIDDSTQEITIDSWEIGSSDEQLSVLQNPIIYDDLTNYTTGYDQAVDAINTAIQNDTNQDTLFGTAPPWLGTGPFSNYLADHNFDGSYPYFYYLYPKMKAGLTDYRNAASGVGYTIRHQTNVSNRWLTNIADFGTGQIYSLAQLLSEISNSAFWNVPCPQRLLYKIANFDEPPAQSNETVGFFKDRSTESTAANNRINITTEYTYGQWNNSLYSPYDGSGSPF